MYNPSTLDKKSSASSEEATRFCGAAVPQMHVWKSILKVSIFFMLTVYSVFDCMTMTDQLGILFSALIWDLCLGELERALH